MAIYRNDPRWIVTKYDGRNNHGAFIPKGTRAFYYPSTGRLLTGWQAEEASSEFEAARFDESQYG